MSLLRLLGIFKNEAGNIRRTLDSARAYVDDWCILDTGSTDGTQAIVREATEGTPGKLYEEPFVDFATSRNRVLELGRVAVEYVSAAPEFTLMLSGDETLVGGDKLREFLQAHRGSDDGAYAVWVVEKLKGGNEQRVPQCRILRTAAGWRYVGDPHEIPEGPDKERFAPVIPGVEVVFAESDLAKKRKRMREYDLPRLRARVSNRQAQSGELTQAWWFLAQTYESLAGEFPRDSLDWVEHALCAMTYYNQCAIAFGPEIQECEKLLAKEPDEKRAVGLERMKAHASAALLSRLRIADALGFLYSAEELAERAQMAVALNPRAPEARYFLALQARIVDVRQGLLFAEEGAEIARQAREAFAAGDASFYLSLDSRMEWLCWGIAASCADTIASADSEPPGKRRSYARKARELAEKAVAAGGPREIFVKLLEIQV